MRKLNRQDQVRLLHTHFELREHVNNYVNNITLTKCGPLFQNGQTSGSSRTLNKIASKSDLKSLSTEKRIFSAKNDVFLT